MHFKSIPNTYLLKLSRCFGSREGSQFYPHIKKKQRTTLPLPSSAL